MPSQFVHIHSINLNTTRTVVDYCDTVVNDTERCRADRFLRPEMGQRWLIARGGLRRVLSCHLAEPPGDLEFSEGKFGKPRLSDRYADSGTHFNLSHSGDLAVVAVTKIGPIGVDIEYMRGIKDWEQVASRFFSRRENEQLDRIAPSAQMRAFYCCWTRKEAVIKATGEGLTANLKSFDVSIDCDNPAIVTNKSGESGDSCDWFLRHLDFGDQYVGAIALECATGVELKDHGNVGWQSA